MPNQVKVEDIKELVQSLDKLPVGIFKTSLNLATYNFTNNLVNLISAKNIDIAAEYVTQLYEEIKLLKDIDVKLKALKLIH